MNLAELSIKRPIFITCVVSLMLILGFVSLSKMSVDLFPDVTFPILSVQTVYPGASPVDMEKLVSKPVEDELASLSGLNKISSQNLESVSLVILEFKIGEDVKEKEQEVRQRLGNIRRNLPDEIQEPIIRRFDPADQAIARIALISEQNPAESFDLADQVIKSQFETLQGVGQVVISGGRKREIQVLVDQKKLQERNLSLLQISDRIKNTSKDVPVGKVESGATETVLRASGEFTGLEQLRKVNVNFLGSDQAVQLNEIAQIQEGLEEEKSETTLISKDGKRSQALFLDIFKQSGGNTVRVVDLVKAQIDKSNAFLKEKKINAQLQMVRDSAWPIRANIADVRESIILGIILCVVVVFFFLGSVRSTFITGMALPNSLLGGFIIMYAMGFSINIMTLLALSLAVGLLIDDAIVVRENIYRHLEMGFSPFDAAIKGTKEVALAVIATTMVVIAVFGPIAFLEGIIGQFFRQFGLTVVFTMLISLFDAFTVAPMLSAYMASASDHKKKQGIMDRVLKSFDRFQTALENRYEKILHWVLLKPKSTLAIGFGIFFLSLMSAGFISKNFLPAGDNGEFVVNIERPVGSSLSSTKEFVRKVEGLLVNNENIDLMATVVGSTGGQTLSNKAQVYVKLVPKKQRKLVTSQVKDEVRRLMKQFQGEAVVNVGDIDLGGGSQKIFNLNVTGENLDELSQYVEKLKAKLTEVPGLVDVDTNYRLGKPEFHIVFDRAKSEALGISTATAGAELRARVEGLVPATYRLNGQEYDIRLRIQEQDKDLRKHLSETKIPNVNFNMIPLSRVAQGVETTGYSQINRQNKARFINIDGNLGPNGNLGNITTAVEDRIEKDPQLKMPAGINYRFQGQAEDFKDLLNNMLLAMGLGILFIYLVLASLYESFIIPVAILLALPMAISGAMFALLISGKSLDIFSMIGFILLMGVVAKNSILLVDYTQILMDEGMERSQALLKACKTRLRPILMTSLALIAGTIPIAIGLNEASAQRTSMGIAIIGGLISSTLLTLIVVPAAYGYIDDVRKFLGKIVKRMRGQNAEPAGSVLTKLAK